MNYSLFLLRFNTAVHFGASDSALSLYASEDHFRADTLFSALCHTALALRGEKGLARLVDAVNNGRLLFSDGMPYKDETLYLPKPMATSDKAAEVTNTERKAMKGLMWIPVEAMDAFCDSVRTGSGFDARSCAADFGRTSDVTKVCIGGNPYPVGTYNFEPECGLYFLMGYETEELHEEVSSLLEPLGLSGIGGKTSAGYGRFSVEDVQFLDEPFDAATEWLASALSNTDGKMLLLSTSLPKEEEMDTALDGAGYRLVRRAGFVRSDTYANRGEKKKTQFFLDAGAVLQHRFSGDLYDVSDGGTHPVYRYGKPIFLGVKL